MLASRPSGAGGLVLELGEGNAELRCDLQCVDSAMLKVRRSVSPSFVVPRSVVPFVVPPHLFRSYVSPMTDHQILYAHLQTLGRVVLGYSGGVDSALLAVAGTRALGPERFLAVIGRSASYPENQYDTALGIARKFGIPVREIETRELADPRYLGNSTERCYFCKSELWTRLAGAGRGDRVRHRHRWHQCRRSG